MRIGIGALVGIVGGPATYARELVAALVRAGGHDYVVFTDQPRAFCHLGIETVEVPLPTPYHQLIWDHFRLPGLVAAARVDLYHGTKNVLPWRLSVPAVVTVHDLAVYTHPGTFGWGQRWHLRLLLPRSVATATRVITPSAHARADVVARFRSAADRTRSVPLGVGAQWLAPPPARAVAGFRARHALGERLIACVGTVQPRKHAERVIEAFARSGVSGEGWELVLAGRLRPGYAPPWLRALPPRVHWLGPLSDDELHALYAAAPITMSASEYEGFGLVLTEAMAGGSAVIAVASSAVPEVVGDAGCLVARSESRLLAEALARLVAEPDRRAALGAQARARAATFSWDATARRTRAVYDEVRG
jgi:glycosyltransferase involved in cell wall biosynthesis